MSKIILFCFFIVILSLPPRVISQEVEDESGFSYDPNSPLGPANWGQLRPEWFLCGNGTMQSPIDLKNATVINQLGGLQTAYNATSATLVNRGHDISIRWNSSPGYIQINGTRYNLDQCHWHTPSEHFIEGQRYDLESHCVHLSNTNTTAVVAILYKVGLLPVPDPLLTLLTLPLITLANGAEQAPAGIIDPRSTQIDSILAQYYRYMGSLTTPRCTEGVIWTVVNQIRPVTRRQIELLQEAVHDGFGFNARPLQALNNRTVLLYKTIL